MLNGLCSWKMKNIINTTHYHQLPFLTFSHLNLSQIQNEFLKPLDPPSRRGTHPLPPPWSGTRRTLLLQGPLCPWGHQALHLVQRCPKDYILQDLGPLGTYLHWQDPKGLGSREPGRAELQRKYWWTSECCACNLQHKCVQIFMLTSFIFLGTHDLWLNVIFCREIIGVVALIEL